MSNGEQTDTGRSYSGRCPIHNVRTYIHTYKTRTCSIDFSIKQHIKFKSQYFESNHNCPSIALS